MRGKLLRGRHRIHVLATDYAQFSWALGQADERDQEKMVHLRSAAALRTLELGPKDELWVIGFPDQDTEALYDALFRVGTWGGWQVWDSRPCSDCQSHQHPWVYRRPYRGKTPEARLSRCRSCEAARERERHEARKVKHRVVAEEPREELEHDEYTEALARYLERRKHLETRYV